MIGARAITTALQKPGSLNMAKSSLTADNPIERRHQQGDQHVSKFGAELPIFYGASSAGKLGNEAPFLNRADLEQQPGTANLCGVTFGNVYRITP